MPTTENKPASTGGMMVVALAGRRIDADDASVARFPLARVDDVRARLDDLFTELGAEALVCSAACGADLLALEVAERHNMRTRILLPFDRAQFKTTSVIDRPGEWAALYDHACDRAEAQGALIIVDSPEGEHAAYTRVTEEILDQALVWANEAASAEKPAQDRVVAVVVWDGQSRGEDDLTAYFRDTALKHGWRTIEVLTNQDGQ